MLPLSQSQQKNEVVLLQAGMFKVQCSLENKVFQTKCRFCTFMLRRNKLNIIIMLSNAEAGLWMYTKVQSLVVNTPYEMDGLSGSF